MYSNSASGFQVFPSPCQWWDRVAEASALPTYITHFAPVFSAEIGNLAILRRQPN